MNKKDIKTLIVFIILCFLIVFFLVYNNKKNTYDEKREAEYLFANYTYSSIMSKAESLFQNTLDILINNGTFTYESDMNGVVKYNIEGIANYKKILNISIASNTLSSDAFAYFMEYKNIIYYEDNYYIKETNINTEYVGSIIEYESFIDNVLYFSSVNYYCSNYEYIGILYDDPECDYYTSSSTFSISYIDNFFKVDNLDEFIEIID